MQRRCFVRRRQHAASNSRLAVNHGIRHVSIARACTACRVDGGPRIGAPSRLVSAASASGTRRGVPEMAHRAAPSKAGVSWSSVTEFCAEQAPAQARLAAWPPPAGVEVHGSDGALGAPRHLAAAAEHRRQVAPPPRRRVLPEGAPAPAVPPPRLRRDEDGDTNAGRTHHPH